MSEILLKLKILIASQEDFETSFHRAAQKISVTEPCPSLLLNGSHVVAGDLEDRPAR
jgi:hypothetical protein